MGKEITYRCDKCGAYINLIDACKNGKAENMNFAITENNVEVYMCQKCWNKFYQMYFEFMKGKASK